MGPSVHIDEMDLPFVLSGSLKVDPNSPGTVIGTLVDENDMFEVAYFSLDQSLIGKPMHTAPRLDEGGCELLMQLYLVAKGTRNFVIVEAVNPHFINNHALQAVKRGMDTATIAEKNWFTRYLSPVRMSAESQPIVVPMHRNTVATRVHYEKVFNLYGVEVIENMWVDFWIDGEVTTGPSDFCTTMKIFYKNTRSTDYPALNSEDNTLQIGLYHGTRVDVVTQGGDGIRSVHWSSVSSAGGGWKFGWGVTAALPFVPLDVTLTYETSDTALQNGNMENFYNNINDRLTRQAGVLLNKNYILESANHHLSANFWVGNYDGNQSNKAFTTVWRFWVTSSTSHHYWDETIPLQLPYVSK